MGIISLENKHLLKGRLVSEGKTRFVCTIEIEGTTTSASIPMSCKIGNLLALNNNEILVEKQVHKQKYPYKLFAVKQGESFVPVSGSFANDIAFAFFSGQCPNLTREKTFSHYRADLFDNTTKTVIEVKSLIGKEKSLVLPNNDSKRTINQLKKIKNLQVEGFSTHFCFVLFSQNVSEILLNTSSQFAVHFAAARELGMKVTILSVFCANRKNVCFEKSDMPIRNITKGQKSVSSKES